MKELKQKIISLQNQSAELEPTREERGQLLEVVSQYLVDYIDRLETEPAFSNKKVDASQLAFRQGRSITEILEVFDSEVANKGIRASSGKHLGYIPGGGIFSSTLGDMLAATTNEYTGIQYASPGGAKIEEVVLDWMKEVFHFPKSAVGNLTSGGSIANLTALTAARDYHQIKGALIEKSVVYVSPQVHHCVHKALRIIGLGDVIIRYITLDQHHRLVSEDLASKIKEDSSAGLNPFLIVASAGTTDTGAVDPIEEITTIARSHQLWVHIDAAYGGFFILTDSKKQLFKGIDQVDSLVVDPHKCLFLPYGIGAVLIKNRKAVWDSFHYTANYMRDAVHNDFDFDAADVSPELTKHFRAMRMWLPLQLHGVAPFIACLEEKIFQIEYMRKCLLKEGFLVGPEPDLSVSYFWYPAPHMDQNNFNQNLLKLIHEDGNVFFSSTVIDEKFVIRIAILSFRTKMQQLDEGIEMVIRHKNALLK